MTRLRARRLLASSALLLALGAVGCSGGDSIPDEPAEEAGAGGGGVSTGEGLEGAGGGDTQPPEGLNQPIPDPGDDLVEPDAG